MPPEIANKSIERHDKFANFYELATLNDWFYRPARCLTLDRLRLTSGETVFDIFCGTGVNFRPTIARVGETGRIIGVDGSVQMLRKAKSEASKLEAGAGQITLLQIDFSTDAGICRLTESIRRFPTTKFLFTLGLSCLPNWRNLFDAVFDTAPHGSRFSIMDVYSERLTLGARILNWIAGSETRRPVWQELERCSNDFAIERKPFRILNTILNVSVVIAAGSKP